MATKYKVKYVIEDCTDDDFSDTYDSSISPDDVFDAEMVAHDIACDHYNDDPCDPNDFEATIGVELTDGTRKYFAISAEPDILIHAREVKNEKAT
jgi:hypothetical protein